MTNIDTIVAEIFNKKSFYPLCLKLAQSKHLADDLHSEFIEVLLKQPDDVIKAQNEKYLSFYCTGIIYNIFNRRDKIKRTVGETSPLHLYANSNITEVDKFDYQPDICFEFEYKLDKVKKVIEREFNHHDKNRMYKARTFYYSQPIPFIKKPNGEFYHVHGNMVDYAKDADIPYNSVKQTCTRFKKFIEKILK